MVEMSCHLNTTQVQLTIYYLRTERKKFYPGLGLEPGSLALHASALTVELTTTSTDP